MKLKNMLTMISIESVFHFCALPAVTGSVYRGGGQCGNMPWDMSKLDSNQDGEMTFEEYSAPKLEKWRSGFDRFDSDGNAIIEMNEWETFLSVHAKPRQ